jgi:hypothetical protein
VPASSHFVRLGIFWPKSLDYWPLLASWHGRAARPRRMQSESADAVAFNDRMQTHGRGRPGRSPHTVYRERPRRAPLLHSPRQMMGGHVASTTAFVIATALTLVWAFSGPFFNYSWRQSKQVRPRRSTFVSFSQVRPWAARTMISKDAAPNAKGPPTPSAGSDTCPVQRELRRSARPS